MRNGSSVQGVGTIVISLGTEGKVENGSVVPASSKQELSVKVHNFFMVKEVPYHTARRSRPRPGWRSTRTSSTRLRPWRCPRARRRSSTTPFPYPYSPPTVRAQEGHCTRP
ncbi:hypothetical protein PG989_000079 [Apiospora arundinis]